VNKRLMQRCLLCIAAALLAGCVTRTQQLGGDPTTGTKQVTDLRNRARIHTELGAKYFQRGQDAVALQELKEAIKADSDYAPAYSMFGVVYMDLRENGLAQENFRRALRLTPDDSEINNNYGWFLCQTGAPKESIPYFMHAVKNPLYETPQRAYLNAGLCSAQMKELTQADDYFQRALRIDPNMPQALLNLALLRFDAAKFGEARVLVGRYNRVVEPTAESLWLALRTERKLGDRGAEASLAAQLRRNFSASREYQDFLKGNFE